MARERHSKGKNRERCDMRYSVKNNAITFKKLIMVAVFLLILIISAEKASLTAQAEGRIASAEGIHYDCIKLSAEDTLESLADIYNHDIMWTDADYIAEIQRINGMTEETLRPGCYLTILRLR